VSKCSKVSTERYDKDTPIHLKLLLSYVTIPYTQRSDEEDYEKSNTWMNAAAVEIDSGDNIDEWSDDELDEEYIAEDG